ncbi:MAG: imidazole glycerol phosphate synthase subunit HisH [Saprospiraceae bacterium]|nr:imidazole glycerol phosphate synthase subunit HisH [Saprospiraceae bacterium]
MKIGIIQYPAGNVRSVQYALERLGAVVYLTNNKEELARMDKVIFPGVGEASTAMESLASVGLEDFIPSLTQPVLGICLGMQLMCTYSEEGETRGLNIIPVTVKKMEPTAEQLKVPHVGWNALKTTNNRIFDQIETTDPYVYYVHSYCVPVNDYTIATTQYGQLFSAAIQKDNFYATQFHPEKSGKIGQQILKNFLDL